MDGVATNSLESKRKRGGYIPPLRTNTDTLQKLLRQFGRSAGHDRQLDLLRNYGSKDVFVHYSGMLQLLASKVVSVVGTRNISEDGLRRAKKLSRELVEADFVVMSGLARGVDTVAHMAAIEASGRTAAVIGTPLDRAYPAENADLQTEIYSRHLLISPFGKGETVFRSNFPARNRVMALLSDATVIVEASDTSGTLHQAAECQRSDRWLFIMKSVAEDPRLTWPSKFLSHPKTRVLQTTGDILEAVKCGDDRN
jgi:DNA protecting protein DprA